MTEDQMKIWERGLWDVNVRGTLEHGSVLLVMDAYRKELEGIAARVEDRGAIAKVLMKHRHPNQKGGCLECFEDANTVQKFLKGGE